VDEFDAVEELSLAIDSEAGLTERQILIVRIGVRLGRMILMPDAIDDYGFTDQEKVYVNAVARAVMLAEADEARDRERRARSARRRAVQLLRSYLSDDQRHQLRARHGFRAVGSAGGVYRLDPTRGRVERVERHGSRWFAIRSYCLHDYAEDAPDQQRIPVADLTLQHLLLLSADEPAFLAAANATNRLDMLWNGDWQRRVAARRRGVAAEIAQTERDVAAMRAADEEIAA